MVAAASTLEESDHADGGAGGRTSSIVELAVFVEIHDS